MTKADYFNQLNAGNCITPCTADQVTWFYEWMNAPVKAILPVIAKRNEPREQRAREMTSRILSKI